MWMPPHVPNRMELFRSTWDSIGTTLSALSIRKAQENLFDRAFLTDLADRCPRLVSFAADGGSFASAYQLSEHIGTALGAQLRILSLNAAPLCDLDAATLLTRTPRLQRLSLHGTSVTAATFRAAVAMHSAQLRAIHMSHLPTLVDADVAALADAPHIVDIRLRRCVRLTDDAFPPALCGRIMALDVRDCPNVGDRTLMAIAGARAPLEEIYWNESSVSEAAIACMLQRCGGTLRVADMRFKSPSSAPSAAKIRVMFRLYCRAGVMQRALLE